MAAPVVRLLKGPAPKITSASLQGKTVFARNCDRPVKAFLGVPYAEPPVKERRFRPPQELTLWNGVRDATTYGPACPQDMKRVKASYGSLPNQPSSYSEDCLYLNVWTPAGDPPQPGLPVMVYLHGGAFVQGFGNIYNGTPIAAYEDVVVVSINYRLGVLGFLRTGSGPDDYHGNQGLLDQLEALRWVQRYIHNFGGDPQNVTVFGQSAGGVSLSYHIMSSQAESLFKRAICQSGPCMVYNGVWSATGGEKYFWKRLESMGFKGRDSKELTKFLSGKTTEELMAAFNDWFVPTVLDGTYLTEQPIKSFQNNRINAVDCVIGFNSTEGVGFIPPVLPDRQSAVKAIETLINKNFFRGFPAGVQKQITELAIREYLTSDNYVKVVCDMYGDITFVAASLLQAELHSAHARCYVYMFDHRPFFSALPEWARADHSNEIAYMFGYPFNMDIPDIWPGEDKELSRTMMNYWANFARNGNPNGSEDFPVWNQFSSDSLLYMKLTVPQCTSSDGKHLWPSRMRLWNKTVPEIIAQSSPSKSKY